MSLDKVLITGASGLLGRSLVKKFSDEGFFVLAHYFRNRGEATENCKWIYGDFSTITFILEFLSENSAEFKECEYLVNSYGPITYRNSGDLTSDDLTGDFFSNVIPTKEVTDYLLKNSKLRSVMNIGFETLGEVKPYKKILSYVMGKNSLQLLTLSYEHLYPETGFNIYSPVSIAGAKAKAENDRIIEPETAASEIFAIMAGGKV